MEQMCDALDGDCLQTWISQNDLFETPCRWVTRVGGFDVRLE